MGNRLTAMPGGISISCLPHCWLALASLVLLGADAAAYGGVIVSHRPMFGPRAGCDEPPLASEQRTWRAARRVAVPANLQTAMISGVSNWQIAMHELPWSKCRVMSGLRGHTSHVCCPERLPLANQRPLKGGELR